MKTLNNQTISLEKLVPLKEDVIIATSSLGEKTKKFLHQLHGYISPSMGGKAFTFYRTRGPIIELASFSFPTERDVEAKCYYRAIGSEAYINDYRTGIVRNAVEEIEHGVFLLYPEQNIDHPWIDVNVYRFDPSGNNASAVKYLQIIGDTIDLKKVRQITFAFFEKHKVVSILMDNNEVQNYLVEHPSN